MTTETPIKTADTLPEGGNAAKSVTFISPRLVNTRVILRSQNNVRNESGVVIRSEPGIAVEFRDHSVTLNNDWAETNSARLEHYDVDLDWVIGRMREHKLWHHKDGWFEEGYPPGAKLPLPSELRPKIVEAAAKGDTEALAAIRDTERDTHARAEVLDEVDTALRALAGEEKVGGEKG